MKHMNKLLVLALVVMSVMAIAVPAMAATTGRYNTPAVHLRNSVGGSSKGLVNNNTTCDVLDAVEDSSDRLWYQVRITSNTTNGGINLINEIGWSWAEFITITSGTAPSAELETMEDVFGSGYLQNGHQGEWVRNLQYGLHLAGELSYGEIDGVFGDDTEAAVIRYQSSHSLDPDGIVGPLTKNALWTQYSTYLLIFAND